jgi:hypothetical protein
MAHFKEQETEVQIQVKNLREAMTTTGNSR